MGPLRGKVSYKQVSYMPGFLCTTHVFKWISAKHSICRSNCLTFNNDWDSYHTPYPVLEESYLCDPRNKDEISNNIISRKGVGNIEEVLRLHSEASTVNSENDKETKDLLQSEMLRIPNRTHPEVIKYGETPKITKTVGDKIDLKFKPKLFHDLAKSMNLLRNDVSNFTGHRSYFLAGQLAELESALIKYSVSKLIAQGFQVISVPDILHSSAVRSCGMETQGKRSQVYSLDSEYHGSDKCLSGTAEMALAVYLMNKQLPKDQLPLRLAAVSRCFRAETSRTSDERGIYRVHQFNKVEMFGVAEPERSGELLEEFRNFQENHFASLGLHLRVLDMPPTELGAQAYRKYDVEAWLPAKEMWAELSSCSDCTDYQSRRLAIRSGSRYLHTVNGTACAVPRLLIALFETHQQSDGSVLIPPPLQHFMKNATTISKRHSKNIPRLKLIKRQTQRS